MSNKYPEDTTMDGSSSDVQPFDPSKGDTGIERPETSPDNADTHHDSRRRGFINLLIGGGLIGWLGTMIYPVLAYLKPPNVPEVNVNSIKAGAVTEFGLNSSKILQFGRRPVILIRLKSGEFRAFQATCTHLDCIVQYRKDLDHIWCACHNGHYDLHGRNISGPPPLPLAAYTVNVVDDEVIVTKSEQIA